MILRFPAPCRPRLHPDSVHTVTDPAASRHLHRLAWFALCAQRGIRVRQHRLDILRWCAAADARALKSLPDGDAA